MKNEKGITLIALIITIIVMLILVGVTINVALNGGLFDKAKQGSFQTEASMVKEQLEIAKAVAIVDNGGKPLDDYSIINIDEYTDLDDRTKDKYRDKIIVNPDGDVCYNPLEITNTQEQDWLKKIGINPYSKTGEKSVWEERGMDISKAIVGKTYSFDGSINDGSTDYYDMIICLNVDGSMYWGRKYNSDNDYTTLDSGTIDDNMGSAVSCSGEKLSFYDGIFGYATVIFNGDSATLYKAGSLGGTEGTGLNTK